MKRRHALTLLGAAFVPRASAASNGGRLNFERGLMGTRFAICCYHPDRSAAEQAAEAAFREAEAINAVASDYIADSELLRLSNPPAGQPVVVSPQIFRLLWQARELAEKTRGHFDPTLGPLTRLWRESRRRKSLPDAATLANAIASCGWRHLVLDPDKLEVTFEKPGMRLDLGGIAKGQAADAMLATLASHGITRACITAGGDVRAGDAPPGTDGWKIGVRSSAPEVRSLLLLNAAVSTSGDFHQFVEIGGTRYSHIIDPATGLGSTRAVSATVIAADSSTADALATACCVAPEKEATKLALSAGVKRVHIDVASGFRKR